jgi:hypothetical protein
MSAPATPSPAKKPRSPAERVIVWGGIILLLGLVAVQAHARFGYEMTLKNLQARVANDDDGSESGNPLYVTDLPGLLVGFPTSSVSEEGRWRTVTYSWQGLGKSYTIRMPYDSSDEKPAIFSLETGDAPPEEVAAVSMEDTAAGASSETTTDMPAASHAGGGGSGGGAGGGGGGRRNIMDSDKDGDGKISKEEASERLAPNFGQWDTNSDGFIDADEVAARMAQMREQGGGPGGGGGGGRRPQAEGTAEAPADAAAAAVKEVAKEAADEKPAEEKKAD